MKITLLCSGSTGNCCLVEEKNTKILIDCGGTKTYLFSSLQSLHIETNNLDALLLTHGHVDHVSQIKHFKDVPAYGTFQHKDHEIKEIATHETFHVGAFEITSIPLSHDFPKTVGYKIVGEETLVYITDTGYVNECLFTELYNAEYIVMESNHDPSMLMRTARPFLTKQRILSENGHLCNLDSARVLSKIIGPNTKAITLAHISKEGNTTTLAYDIVYEELLGLGIDMNAIHLQAAEAFEFAQMGDMQYD